MQIITDSFVKTTNSFSKKRRKNNANNKKIIYNQARVRDLQYKNKIQNKKEEG
jgi:hypothetical protein